MSLTEAQGRQLAASGVVNATRSRGARGEWLVSPRDKVGAVRIGDIEIHIAPKVQVKRLLFLLGYVSNPVAWRDETVTMTEESGLVPVVAQILWRQVERAVDRGLLQGYCTEDQTSMVLRGRLRETAQMHRHVGKALPLEIRYDEFSTDVPENQILRTAVERMLRVPGVDLDSRRRLRRLRRTFAEITPLAEGDAIPLWLPTRLNARYHIPLRTAELVLRATSVEHGLGGVHGVGFLLDMWRVFEDFVTVALSQELQRIARGRTRLQSQHPLVHDRSFTIKPDLLWYSGDRPAAVVDAKYKVPKANAKAPNADLYQILAYCTVFGLRCGHLVYADGPATPVRRMILGSDTEVYCHGLDLTQAPDVLLARIASIAGQVVVPAAR